MHCPRASSLHLKLSASYRHTSAVRTVSLIKKEDLYKKNCEEGYFLRHIMERTVNVRANGVPSNEIVESHVAGDEVRHLRSLNAQKRG